MKDSKLLEIINSYGKKLESACSWHNSHETIAPVIQKDSDKSNKQEHNYVYEFFCYLCIINDLSVNYSIEFVKGFGDYEYKFPQAASLKKGKPRFEAFKNGKKVFQICAGTRVFGVSSSEDINPDISFQMPDTGNEPSKEDLIIILDAKYQDDFSSRLKSKEFQSFCFIVNQYYCLASPPKIGIFFDQLKDLFGNCLITNVRTHNAKDDMIKLMKIKEVTNFYPDLTYKVVG